MPWITIVPMETATTTSSTYSEKPELTSNTSQIENVQLENPISQRTSITQ